MTRTPAVKKWLIDVGLADIDWGERAQLNWLHRLSLFETQMESALELSSEVALAKIRRNESMHRIVTRAIAEMVPVSQVSNVELLRILFGLSDEVGVARDDKRAVRNFRNEQRPLKLDTAVCYILDLVYSRKIPPAEGGRLWYVALLYASAITVVNEQLKQKGSAKFAALLANNTALMAKCHKKFEAFWESSLKKSCAIPIFQPRSEFRRFLDYCAFVQWQESRIKRNPLVGVKRMIELAAAYNKFEFES